MHNYSGQILVDKSAELALISFLSHAAQGTSPLYKCEVPTSYCLSQSTDTTNSDNARKLLVVPLEGLLMLEPQYNYDGQKISLGTREVANMIENAINDSTIEAILIRCNSGGGFSTASGIVISAIQDFQSTGRKVYGAIESVCGSLALEILSYCDFMFATNNSAMIGCIGSQVTIPDYSKLLEKWGIKMITIKSTLTPDKNGEVEAALKGDIKTILTRWVDPSAQDFIDTVKSNRPNISEKALKGGTYLAKDAEQLGLIDGIMSLKQLSQKIFGKFNFSQSEPTKHQEEMQLSLIKMGVICEKLGVAIEASSTDEQLLDAISVKIVDNEKTLSDANATISQLQQAKTDLETERTDLTAKVSEKDAEIVRLQALVDSVPTLARHSSRQQADDTPPVENGADAKLENYLLPGEQQIKATAQAGAAKY